MKARLAILNILLVLGVAAVAWKAKSMHDDSEAKRNATLHVPVKPTVVPPVVHTPKPEAATPAKYNDVAQKNLFAKDRNPQVIIDPPKPPDPPKPMPKLPVVYGVMGLPSGVKAVMSDHSGGASSVVKTGDSIGDFKVLALDLKKVTFEWNDKQVTKNIDDLLDRAGPKDQAGNAVAAAPAPVPAAGVATISSEPNRAGPEVKPNPTRGVEIGAAGSPSMRSCAPGDTTPPGTVVDGYKKIAETNPFGTVCRWVKQ